MISSLIWTRVKNSLIWIYEKILYQYCKQVSVDQPVLEKVFRWLGGNNEQKSPICHTVPKYLFFLAHCCVHFILP
jgi:hypothetical protein